MHAAKDVFAAMLASDRAIGIYSHRDLRDVVFSAIQKRSSTFDSESQEVPHLIETDKFWRAQPRTLIQSYDAIMHKPVECVREIAVHLDVTLHAGEDEFIAAQYSLEQNRLRAERVKIGAMSPSGRLKKVIDPETLLHHDHIHDARTGKWRNATPSQLTRLAELCGHWLIERGYEVDLAWSELKKEQPAFAPAIPVFALG